jgi:hypothetical protein
MAGYYARVLRRQFAFDDVEIGAADSTGADAQQDMAGAHSRICNLSDLKWSLGNWSG